MDPKTTPSQSPDESSTPGARQVSVDIHGAPDMPAAGSGNETMSADMPAAPSTSFDDAAKLSVDAPGPASTPAPVSADPMPGPGVPSPAGPEIPTSTPGGAGPSMNPLPTAQPEGARPLFAPDHPGTLPGGKAHPASQGRRMMVMVGGLLVILVIAVVVAYVMTR